jgi:hypothetical protein
MRRVMFMFAIGSSILCIARGGSTQVGNTYTAWLTWWEVDIPYAAIVLLTAACAVLASRRALRKQHRPGRCHRCGYDLRATPDRCPECGAITDEFQAAGVT